SMKLPAGGPTIRNGMPAAKVTMPTNDGEFVTMSASQPSAICCIHCPTEPEIAPSQSWRKVGYLPIAPRNRCPLRDWVETVVLAGEGIGSFTARLGSEDGRR